MSAGKRGPVGPLVNTSDEDSDPDSPRGPRPEEPLTIKIPSPGPISPTEHDHDYDNVSSPSSTASGPTYIRQPGFTHHAHKFVVKPNKVKKKKLIPPGTVNLDDRKLLEKPEPVPPTKPKPRRDPLPMRLRALPQSFWQQPNVPHNVSPASAYPTLPPLLVGRDHGEDVTEMRPVTPPTTDEKEKTKPRPKIPDRKITIANTDLLFKLFDTLEKDKKAQNHKPRGRPRKTVTSSNKSLMTGEDPYMMEAVSDKLFPQLTMETSKPHTINNGHSSLQLVTLREGDKSVTLPSLSVEQNYSQMLSELVMHI